MNISRREFMQMLSAAAVAGIWMPTACSNGGMVKSNPKVYARFPSESYDLPVFGNVSLLHFTDVHAQLMPIYYREPDIHIGVGAAMENKMPHLVGKAWLDYLKLDYRSPKAYIYSHLNFAELAQVYGKVGGFAHLATLVKRLRASRPHSLLLDGGDTWQGSATSLWTNAQDMVDACKLLGVDVMTGHWEFTYGAERLQEIIKKDFAGHIDFVAQNVVDKEFEDRIFEPYVIKEINGIQVAIVGQAFPYTPVANPQFLFPEWQFGIRDEMLQQAVNRAREDGAQLVVLLSHNGMDTDLKVAAKVSGIDIILGGHTHDAVPQAMQVSNRSGKTVVINSGTSGKFLAVLDVDVRPGGMKDYRFNLLPVFSNVLEADPEMAAYIEKVRAPFAQKLNQPIATAGELLYRRGTFSGTFDQLIVDALLESQNAEVAFSPGFRWGTTMLPGQTITQEDLMAQTAITYPRVTRSKVSGRRIKDLLEDIADNRFNPDPYYQQGGDMVRVGGLSYTIDPNAPMNKRISDMEINGKAVKPNKEYVLAAWASQEKQTEGPLIWDVVAEHLRQQKEVVVKHVNVPKIKNVKNNQGIDHDLHKDIIIS